MSNNLKNIFLNDLYVKLGAKFSSFAGYSMPIYFPKGIINEHLHTRSKCGIFDVSHMGQMLIPVNNININKLESLIPYNLNYLSLNNCAYSFILNNSGGIIDDIIISRIFYNLNEYFFIVYNASRKKNVETLLNNLIDKIILINDNSLIAIQGPHSSNILSKIFPSILSLNFMQIAVIKLQKTFLFISRSGYTGEDGFELSIPNSIVKSIINKIKDFDEILFCGLGSRDSLRLEAGLCLYGNELKESISPIEANLKWAISKSRLENKNFNGCERIIKEIKYGVSKKLIGIKSANKNILRSNMILVDKKDENIGIITSGGYSPSLNISIAMGFIQSKILEQTEDIYCLIRNKKELVKISNLPFVQHKYKRSKK